MEFASLRLFRKVQKLQSSYSSWLVVGMLPERLQELVEDLSEPKEWEMNFKAIKQKRKEMDKIPDTMKIDCFTISTVILKSVIEDQLDRLMDALIISLKRRASDEAKQVMLFLEERALKWKRSCYGTHTSRYIYINQ